MSRKRRKWKFSPARKRRPVERASSAIPELDEILAEPEEAAEAAEIAVEEDFVEEAAEAIAKEDFEEEAVEAAETAAEEDFVKETAETAAEEVFVEEAAETAAEEDFVEEVAETADEEDFIEEVVEAAETAAVVDFTEEPAETAAAEDFVEEAAETAAEEAPEEAATEENFAEAPTEALAEEEAPAPEEHRSWFDEKYGEETAAAKELPDYFFDENDIFEGDKFEDEPDDEPGSEQEDVFEEDFEEDFEDELEDEFEDELEDEFEAELNEEPQLSLYERASSGKKRGKKKGSGKNKKGKKRGSDKAVVRIGDLVLGDGVPKICVPITGRTREEIAQQAKAIAAVSPDLVEWRVDYLEEAGGKKDIIDILVGIKRTLGDIPLLFTYRTEGEGGNGRVGWGHYSELLEWAACRPEIDLIDVEAMGLDVDTEGLIHVIHGRGTPVIASVHYCGDMPGKKERKEALRFLKQSGGDIIKMAFTPRNEEDVLDLMVWTRKKSKKTERPLITMAMGDVGKMSRISGRLTGSAVTFGSVGEGSAPGQIPAEELKTILKQL